MPGPAPNPNRQRRNKVATRAIMEAPAVTPVGLPVRELTDGACAAVVVLSGGCTLAPKEHDVPGFVSINVEPHDFQGVVVPWHKMTVTWWNTIWASPLIEEWVDADVPGLFALAALVDEFWNKPTATLGAEIRFEAREFGLSPLSRRQLQWEIKRLEGKVVAPPVARTPSRARDPRLRLVKRTS